METLVKGAESVSEKYEMFNDCEEKITELLRGIFYPEASVVDKLTDFFKESENDF
jgi:hypothetical protein